MSAVKLLPHYSYDDYCNWEGRWELIEGLPFAMSPTPSPRHQWVVANIIYELKKGIKEPVGGVNRQEYALLCQRVCCI